MKLSVTIALVVFVALASGSPQPPKFSYPSSPFFPRDDPPCKPGCSPDCSSVTFCNGDQTVTINCREQTAGQRPFCNTDLKQCDATGDNCTPEASGSCNLPAGYYPDILDCKRSYYCDGTKRTNYNCIGNAVYNVLTEDCEMGVQCLSFDSITGLCKDKPGKMMVHPLKKSLYIYCRKPNNPTDQSVLFMCPSDNYEFDPLAVTCSFICRAAGRFPDVENAAGTTYYECVKNGNIWVKNKRPCPANTHFEPKEGGKGRCVPNAY